MNQNLSNNSYKNLTKNSFSTPIKVYQTNAKIIDFAEQKLKRRQKPQEYYRSKLYLAAKYKTKPQAKKDYLSKFKHFYNRDTALRWLFVSSFIVSLIMLFFVIGQSIIK